MKIQAASRLRADNDKATLPHSASMKECLLKLLEILGIHGAGLAVKKVQGHEVVTCWVSQSPEVVHHEIKSKMHNPIDVKGAPGVIVHTCDEHAYTRWYENVVVFLTTSLKGATQITVTEWDGPKTVSILSEV